MTSTLTYTGTLKITRCWCGIELAVPQALYDHARESSNNAIFCPLGHKFVFRKNEATRQRERAEDLARQLEVVRGGQRWERDQRLAAERSARAFKGHVTRLRNRIANGVCPVAGCRRHFDNVQAHIAGQHPDWAAEHPEALS